MVPLIVVTALFSVYINEQHFKVTKNRKFLCYGVPISLVVGIKRSLFILTFAGFLPSGQFQVESVLSKT